MQPKRTWFVSAKFALAALLLGLTLGNLCARIDPALAASISPPVELLGGLWIQALRMVVIPLLVTRLILGLTGATPAQLGRMVRFSLGLFLVLHFLGGLYALPVSRFLIRWIHVERAWAPSFSPQPLAEAAGPSMGSFSPGDWLLGLIPGNVFQALANGEIPQIMLFFFLLGMAINRLPNPAREQISTLVGGLADAVMTVVWWVLLLTPVGIFSVAYSLGRQSGFEALGVLGQFILLLCSALLGFTLLLYPLACLMGGVSLPRFMRAAYPGQLVALTTRSSLASVPALMEGAERHLALPLEVSSFVFSFSVTLFRANRMISSTGKLLFLCFLYGIDLTWSQLLTFSGLTIILSISSAGIPGGGGMSASLPAYMAVGVPLEGVLRVETVDVIPDTFKTLVNVTAYTAVAVVVNRWLGQCDPCSAGLAPTPVTE